MKPEVGHRYLTKCGFIAEVYRTTAKTFDQSTNFGQAIGAVLIPIHPAAFPGWEAAEWDAETGKSRDNSPMWDIETEIK